jgi:hypothetical protein
MITDALLKFSAAQAVTASAASTDYLDLGVARDFGAGERLFVLITVDVAMTDLGSDSTVAVALQYDSTTSFTPDASQTLVTIPAATAAGVSYAIPVSFQSTPYRYAQIYYTVANGNLSTGSFTAQIIKDADLQYNYADAIVIS